jgi:hypothetical protein
VTTALRPWKKIYGDADPCGNRARDRGVDAALELEGNMGQPASIVWSGGCGCR